MTTFLSARYLNTVSVKQCFFGMHRLVFQQQLEPKEEYTMPRRLAVLQQSIVCAMKCKQTVNKEMVEKLQEACRTFEQLYLGEK